MPGRLPSAHPLAASWSWRSSRGGNHAAIPADSNIQALPAPAVVMLQRWKMWRSALQSGVHISKDALYSARVTELRGQDKMQCKCTLAGPRIGADGVPRQLPVLRRVWQDGKTQHNAQYESRADGCRRRVVIRQMRRRKLCCEWEEHVTPGRYLPGLATTAILRCACPVVISASEYDTLLVLIQCGESHLKCGVGIPTPRAYRVPGPCAHIEGRAQQ